MLLQRLIRDDITGFANQEMGFVEYEGDATFHGMNSIARAFLEHRIKAKAVKLTELWGRIAYDPIDVVILSTDAFLENIGEVFVCPPYKTRMCTDDPGIVAWMRVGREEPEDPVFIVRIDLGDSQDRINTFFKDVINRIQLKHVIADT